MGNGSRSVQFMRAMAASVVESECNYVLLTAQRFSIVPHHYFLELNQLSSGPCFRLM